MLSLTQAPNRVKNDQQAILCLLIYKERHQPMFFEINKETKNKLQTLLGHHGLINNKFLMEVNDLYTMKNLSTFIEVLAQCHMCKYGRYSLNRACFDKLVLLMEMLNIQHDDDALENLAESGLLNEETIDLFAENPNAFADDNYDSDDSKQEQDLKKRMQTVINEQKRRLSKVIPLDNFSNNNAETCYLLRKSNLPIISNAVKMHVSLKDNEIFVLNNVLGLCHKNKDERYHLNQECLDMLIELIPNINRQADEDDDLYTLAAEGLLNKETIALFAIKPSTFSDESYGTMDEQRLKKIIAKLIHQQQNPSLETESLTNPAYVERLIQYLLIKLNLPVISNQTKIETNLKTNELHTLLKIMMLCHSCEYGSYDLNQECFDRLIDVVQTLDIQDDEETGLLALAESGLLNEESIELFSENIADFWDVADRPDKNSDLQTEIQKVIDEHKVLDVEDENSSTASF